MNKKLLLNQPIVWRQWSNAKSPSMPMRRNLLLLLAILYATSGFSQITYVTVTGAGLRDGTSWSNALADTQLRPALFATPPSTPNAAIWVAAGTYHPHQTSRDSSFRIHPLAKVYGGFAGTETLLSQRNFTTNLTVLSGEIGLANDSSDNSFNVVKFDRATDAVLDGFTITGGNANSDNNYFQQVGGGISNLSTGSSSNASTPHITNCRIVRNYAIGSGGGLCNIAVAGNAHAQVTNCTFEQNQAILFGGAIFSSAVTSAGRSALTVNGTSFLGNRATATNSGGGAISVMNTGNVHDAQISRSQFENNTAGGVGGAVSYGSSAAAGMSTPGSYTVLIDSSTFTRNSATVAGTAVYLESKFLGAGNLTISNTSFNDQRASGTNTVLDLGHTSSLATTHKIISCTFTNNRRGLAGTTIRSVAGFGAGGSISYTGTDSLLVSNSFFYNNGNGTDIAAVARDGAKHTTIVANSTLFHDATTTTVATGIDQAAENLGGSNIPGATDAGLFVQNSILWHQLPAAMANAQVEIKNHVTGASVSAVHSQVSNSILTGASTPWPTDYGNDGGNNSGAYPGFVDTAMMDFRLRCGTFGVDKGNNALIAPAGLAKDLAGSARIYNNTVDIGAYETDPISQQPPLTPVININAHILSYAYFASGVDSIRWTFGTGANSTQRTGIYSYAQAGTYTVCLTVKNACATRDTCFQVTINNTAGIGQLNGEDQLVTFYPNPVTSQMHLQDVQDREILSIYNIMGAGVYRQQLQRAQELTVDLSNLAPGNYILELRGEGGSIRRARFVKQ